MNTLTAIPCVTAAFGCLWISLSAGAILGLVTAAVIGGVSFIMGEEARDYQERA